jgi:hypothetical protein
MSGVKAGLDNALDETDDEPGSEVAVQDDLFADPVNGAAASPLSALLEPQKRKAGRPPGALNERTKAVQAWLLSQNRHPLAVMAEAYSMSTIDLAKAIGMQPVQDRNKDGVPVGEPYWPQGMLYDLFKLQMDMAKAVTPYVAAPMPQEVKVAQTAPVNIAFLGVNGPGGVSVGARGEPGENFPAEEDVMGVKIIGQSEG